MPYTPRRQSAKWLDSDCPQGVLAIYDDPRTMDRYTIIYREPVCGTEYRDMRLSYLGSGVDPRGISYHGEFSAHDCAMFRYVARNRAAKWSGLPEDVKQLVRRDCRLMESSDMESA